MVDFKVLLYLHHATHKNWIFVGYLCALALKENHALIVVVILMMLNYSSFNTWKVNPKYTENIY